MKTGNISKIPTFKEFTLIPEIRYINHNLNKSAIYLCKIPKECYRQEVLLGFSKERNYYLVAVKKDFIGKSRNVCGLEETGRRLINSGVL